MAKGKNRIALSYLKQIAKLTAEFILKLEEEEAKYTKEATNYYFVRLTETEPWMIAQIVGQDKWMVLDRPKFGQRLVLYKGSDFFEIGENILFPK